MNQSDAPALSSAIHTQRIAFIKANWHSDIVDRCHTTFLEEIARRGFPVEQVDTFSVPGAYEIPLQAKFLAKSDRYAAIVAAGFVVDGGIYRHEFVASAVIEALMDLQMETEVPTLSAVLTPHHFHEHETHIDFFREHFAVKGVEVATACLETMENIHRIRALTSR